MAAYNFGLQFWTEVCDLWHSYFLLLSLLCFFCCFSRKNVSFPSSFDSLDVISGTGQWPHIMLLIELPCIITRELITTFCVPLCRGLYHYPLLHQLHSQTGSILRVLLCCDFMLKVSSHVAFRWPALFTSEDRFCSLKALWTSLLPAQGS